MKGFKLNPNRDYVEKIIDGIYRKDGHCPCQLLFVLVINLSMKESVAVNYMFQ